MVLGIKPKPKHSGRRSVRKDIAKVRNLLSAKIAHIHETAGKNASKGVELYIAEAFVKYIVADPNIASAISNRETRGAIGLWKTVDVKKSIAKTLKLKMWRNRAISKGFDRKGFEIKLIKENFNDAVRGLRYKSERSKNKTRGGKRGVGVNTKEINWFDWLLNPSHGVVAGYSVWPGLGKSSEFMASRGLLSSRSGTHTMVNAGSFAIKNWLPRKTDAPNLVDNFIKKITPSAHKLFEAILLLDIKKKSSAIGGKRTGRELQVDNIDNNAAASQDPEEAEKKLQKEVMLNSYMRVIIKIYKASGRAGLVRQVGEANIDMAIKAIANWESKQIHVGNSRRK